MRHEVVNIAQSAMSCGVLTMHRLSSDSYSIFYTLATHLYHPSRGEPAAFVVFSDVEAGVGDTIAERVLDGGFGSVTISDAADNPHTGNVIQVYVWNINHEKFKAWYASERVKRLSRVGR